MRKAGIQLKKSAVLILMLLFLLSGCAAEKEAHRPSLCGTENPYTEAVRQVLPQYPWQEITDTISFGCLSFQYEPHSLVHRR